MCNEWSIPKSLALYLLIHAPDICIVCSEYGDDEDSVQVLLEDYETLIGPGYQTFWIWRSHGL